MLPPLLLGMARGWLDADGEGMRALRWSFGSKCLNAALAAVFVLMPGAAMLAGPESSGSAYLTVLAIAALCSAALPFFAWNRTTLSRAALERWWIPFWPGWAALAAVFTLSSLSAVLGFVADAFSSIYGGSVASLALQAADWLADLLIGPGIALIWLDRGRFGAVRGDLRRAIRWPVLGAVIWQSLWLALCVGAWAWPVLLRAALAIYVIPQYGASASAGGPALSDSLKFIAGIAGMDRVYFPMLAGMLIPAVVYASLALGRLLVRRGIGA